MKEIEFKSVIAEFKAIGEGIFEGYAAYFNNKDKGDDVILSGAFAKTIVADKDNIKLIWNHDWDDVPIGNIISMEEKPLGLYVQCKLNNTSKALDVKEAIATGAVTKFSIGYKCNVWETIEEKGEWTRYIKEVKLFEVSPVNFPMNDMANITGYKKYKLDEQATVNHKSVIKKIEEMIQKNK